MTTVTISLPETLKAFIDEQLATKGYGNVGEYFRSLLREARAASPYLMLTAECQCSRLSVALVSHPRGSPQRLSALQSRLTLRTSLARLPQPVERPVLTPYAR